MNKKNNKIIIPLLVLVAFIGGSVWTYLVINQLNRGTTNSVPTSLWALTDRVPANRE